MRMQPFVWRREDAAEREDVVRCAANGMVLLQPIAKSFLLQF